MLAVAFLLKLHQLRLRALTEDLTALCDSFVEHGGFFGSINTDTEDLHESVAYAIGFQVLLAASQFLGRPVYRDFAHDVCLAGLRVFRINRDLNDLPTKGLTRLAANYSSACFWENAEVALAYFQAARDTGNQLHARDGMTILRAIARNRIGSNGFLTAELDWDGRLPPEKHVGATARGPRVVTHPYMNSLNLLAPTLFYLQHLAWKSAGEPPVFHDLEGVQLWPI